MTHVLRFLITMLAGAGLAYPSITPRPARGRSCGFSRGYRLRIASQADCSHLLSISNAADRKFLSAEGSAQDYADAELLNGSIRCPNEAAVPVLIPPSEAPPLQQYPRNTFGRAPPR